MKYVVTGCAGFVGSHLTDRLLQNGHTVIGIDNLSTGRKEFLQHAKSYVQFDFIQKDLLTSTTWQNELHQVDAVFHLAANADVRFGTLFPGKDLEQNTLVTFNVLEAMRKNNIKKIIFASTGSIYGETNIIPTPEDAPFPVQTSLYGASKLAAEGLIEAYSHGFGLQSYIFRFVSLLGERYTHGHVIDFYRQLLAHPNTLHVLGNGQQRKSYLYIEDCIDAILFALNHAREPINIFNLGTDEYCTVNDSIEWLCDYLKLNPTRTYTGEERGWIGDNPFIFLDCKKIRNLGWQPRLSIREAVLKTAQFLTDNKWLFAKTVGEIA